MFDEIFIMNYLFRKLSVILLFVLSTFLVYVIKAINLFIEKPAIVGGKLMFIIQLDNSWNASLQPSICDAELVFEKRQGCGAAQTWEQALLSTNSANHTVEGGLIQVDAVTCITSYVYKSISR